MGPEERKVSSRVHTDALKPFHPHVGKLLCWNYIKLLKANKTTLLGSLKVYFYLMMTFALGVRYSSRKPTRAASMEQILKRTKKPLFLFKSSILVNVRPIAVINERVMSQCTRGGWNSTAVWNTILAFQSLFKTRAAGPAQSGFAQGSPRGRCTLHCPGQLCGFVSGTVFPYWAVCHSLCTSQPSLPWGLKLWLPIPSHPFPPSLSAMKTEQVLLPSLRPGGAHSPVQNPNMDPTVQGCLWIPLLRAVHGSHCSGLSMGPTAQGCLWVSLFRAVPGSHCSELPMGWGGLCCSTALQGHLWREELGKTGNSNGRLAALTGLLPKYLKTLF